jgi:signal transduction histidine kinase/HAMP domain-containing protein
MKLYFPHRWQARRSIGATIFGAFVVMGLLTAVLGGYGIYVLTAAGNFVVDLYDRPLMATNFERAAAVDFAQMDKELARRDRADEQARAAIDERIAQLSRVFFEDLAVAEARSLSVEERAAIEEIERLVARWNELRLGQVAAVADELDRLAAGIVHRFDLLAEATTGQSFVARRKVVSAVSFFKYSSIAALVAALLLSAGITLLLMRRIIRPLREAAAIADRIADGEMQAPIPPGGPDETGVLLRSMTVMQDSIRIMVEREKAQRRSAQTRLVDALESSCEAIVLVDDTGRIVIANSQLARFFPTIAPHLEPGMSFTEAFRRLEFADDGGTAPDAFDPTAVPVATDCALSGSEFCLADGRWLRVSRSITHDGGFFLVISDISDLKEREQRLDEARRLAEAASEAKSSFLATMSHELRTPLNAVIGFSELLSHQMFGPLGSPKYLEYADSIQHSGRHLLGVINNVLDLSKHHAGKLRLMIEPLDLGEIVVCCAAMMRDQCTRAGLGLRVRAGDALTMEGDPGKLQQMLLNLLSNAVKFTDAGGSVTVTVELSGDNRITVQVADTGIGMAPEQIPVALAIFGQVDTRLARRYEGTGLGLPLVKSIIELHGGELVVDSAPGQGTTVTVSLPREQAVAAAEADRPRQLERVA